jgi:hypothetical protein
VPLWRRNSEVTFRLLVGRQVCRDAISRQANIGVAGHSKHTENTEHFRRSSFRYGSQCPTRSEDHDAETSRNHRAEHGNTWHRIEVAEYGWHVVIGPMVSTLRDSLFVNVSNEELKAVRTLKVWFVFEGLPTVCR